MARSTGSFSHHSFPDDPIPLAVRWYVRFPLSCADVVEWLTVCGLGKLTVPNAKRRVASGRRTKQTADRVGDGHTLIVVSIRTDRWSMSLPPRAETRGRRSTS
jgi:hypothetical protein